MKKIILLLIITVFLCSCGNNALKINSNFTEDIVQYIFDESDTTIYSTIINYNLDTFTTYFKIETNFYEYLTGMLANEVKLNKETFFEKYNYLIENIPNEYNNLIKEISGLDNIEYKHIIDFNIFFFLIVSESSAKGEINGTPLNQIFSNVNKNNLNKIKGLFSYKDKKIMNGYKILIIEKVIMNNKLPPNS